MNSLNEVVKQIKEAKLPFYVYLMYKPDGTPFYVGKGTAQSRCRAKHERVTSHESEAKQNQTPQSLPYRNWLKVNTIRKVWRGAGRIGYIIDSWHANESDAFQREMELIKQIGCQLLGTGSLTNLTEGGEGETGLPETNERISVSLKQYYQDHPERIKELCQQRKKWEEENPEGAKKAFQEGGKTAVKIMHQWMRDNPEAVAEQHKQHSGFMTEWHQNNREKTKEVAAKRNVKFRTPEHRQHMAEMTRKYAAQKSAIRNECLEIIKSRSLDIIPPKWNGSNLETWQKFREELERGLR